ncbi:MAG: ADP-ribosylation factor family protein [Candidatus Odinarchaeota archaeon]
MRYGSLIPRLKKSATDHLLKIKVVWIGLEQAGKTTIIRRLITGEFRENITVTMGIHWEEFYSRGLMLGAWDIAGQAAFRVLWNNYIKEAMGIVFVVDAADYDRLDEAKRELREHVFNNEQAGNIPVLVLANKQDLPGALPAGTIARRLALQEVREHSYAIVPVSAKTGFNIEVAMDWLRAEALKLVRKKT